MRDRRNERREAPEAPPPELRIEGVMWGTLPEPPPREPPPFGGCDPRTPHQQALDHLDIALDEIRRAEERHPKALARLVEKDALMLLRPTDALLDDDPRELRPSLYREHCKELLDRLANGKDLRPGTTAELIGALRAHHEEEDRLSGTTVKLADAMRAQHEVGRDRIATLLLSYLENRENWLACYDETFPHGDTWSERRAVRRLEASLRKKLACERMAE